MYTARVHDMVVTDDHKFKKSLV